MPGEYEHMELVDGRHLTGLAPEKVKEVTAVAKAVCGRTGTKCSYCVTSGKILFHYGDEPFGGPLVVEVFKVANTTSCIDGMVHYINLGKMPRIEKDRIIAANEAAEKQEREKLGQKFREDIRVDVLKHAEFLNRKRRGVGTLVLPLSQ